MIHENDVKLFAYLYTFHSESLSEDEKVTIADFIDENTVEETMNLLMTGSPTSLTESERYMAELNFQESQIGALLEDLNLQAENIIVIEGIFPRESEIKAFELVAKYVVTTKLGQAHATYAGVIGNKIAKLLGAAYDLGPFGTVPNPLQMDKYMNIQAGTFVGMGAIGAGLVVSAVSYIGYKIYKKIFKSYESKCNGMNLKGKAKKACISYAKVGAFEAQIQAMKTKQSLCGKSKDPEKCKGKLSKKLNKMEAKLTQAKAALSKAQALANQAASKVKNK